MPPKGHKRTPAQLEKERIQQKANRDKWRTLALASLGGKCVWCGFNDVRALQIDHVNGGGVKELRSWNHQIPYYKKVVRESDSGIYQLLCANCNWIKRHVRGEHC